ncbi:MAG: nucleotidyltransferase [Lachnospiraceae bacterium]|nr:nucleotidyltransferase [Lachnospiraceae bacterium]
MGKPTLVILAAGMGSRYGGLKQIDPIDQEGHKIIDFSIYDAMHAGFGKVVFIIKKEHEADFRSCIGDAVSKHIEVEYVFQDLQDVPAGLSIPEGRVKPWGTTHALMCCKEVVNEPFAVINADDYYGKSAYTTLVDFLSSHEDVSVGNVEDKPSYAMVGYQLKNTLTDKGSVARGCCVTDSAGFLAEIVERTRIIKTDEGAAFSEDEGTTWTAISPDTLVSMNMWAFYPSVFSLFEKAMEEFFLTQVEKNPMKAECLIPTEVGGLLEKGRVTVKVLSSQDKWFGVTYQEDKPFVKASIQELKDRGVYPEKLWE